MILIKSARGGRRPRAARVQSNRALIAAWLTSGPARPGPFEVQRAPTLVVSALGLRRLDLQALEQPGDLGQPLAGDVLKSARL